MDGQPVPPDDQQCKKDHDQSGPYQAQLLADNRENEVIVLLGKEHKLLAALAKAQPQKAAGANGDKALRHLEALVRGIPEGVPPGGDPVGVIADLLHQVSEKQQVAAGGTAGKARRHPAPVDAPYYHQHRANPYQQHHAGSVRLHGHQHRDSHQHEAVGQYAVFEGQHLLPLLGDGGGKVNDDAQLCKLRRLELKRGAGDPQPTPGAVAPDANAGNRHQNQQDKGCHYGNPCQAPEPLVVDLGYPEHGKQAQQGKGPLALEIVEGIIAAGLGGLGGRETGGEKHNETDDQQYQRQQQEGQIHGAPGGLPSLPLTAALFPDLLAFVFPLLFPGHGEPSFPLFAVGRLSLRARDDPSRRRAPERRTEWTRR